MVSRGDCDVGGTDRKWNHLKMCRSTLQATTDHGMNVPNRRQYHFNATLIRLIRMFPLANGAVANVTRTRADICSHGCEPFEPTTVFFSWFDPVYIHQKLLSRKI